MINNYPGGQHVAVAQGRALNCSTSIGSKPRSVIRARLPSELALNTGWCKNLDSQTINCCITEMEQDIATVTIER